MAHKLFNLHHRPRTISNVSSSLMARGYTRSTSINQQWQLIGIGGGYFKIKNRNSGKILSISGGSDVNGALIVQNADTNTWSQNFKFHIVEQ
ncbi:hypothetical protein GCM10008018_42800 [Paenibacillus marchantiophytorum]|uniref:Ricin B lectin domain-containing protein n=2 Tax=Paenibacillus marchantiophytorum TaxID=1619310 RepID=A0ABQ1EXH6_9BACL|nr:hypothetical protein GCM10008018_42800 [Paenibacillus marchantiophytorum]